MRKLIILLMFIISAKILAQTDSSTVAPNEIFVIDSYITPEDPHKLIVSFSTTDSSTSIIQLKKKQTFVVSKNFEDTHRIEIDLTGLKFDSTSIKYRLYARNRRGIEIESEEYEVELPKEIVLGKENEINWYQMCIGGIVFAIPTIEYVQMGGGEYLGLSKEIPLINFYNGGYNYPQGYVGLEYTHYLNAPNKNFLRLGYKQMFQFEEIKYISPGLSFFSNFLGYNGLSAEVSLGLFQIRNLFTVYTRYRYNFQLTKNGNDFNEFAIGLYANFLSINF